MKAGLGVAVALVAAASAVLSTPWATAQQARSPQEDPSARSAGMGGASIAVLWSDDLNDWSNPALLGYARGLRYGWTNTNLIPYATDVTFQTDRFSYGWGGIGLAVERHTLNYGRIDLTDSQGIPIGYYEPSEHIRSLSGGVSVSRALEALAALRGASPPRFTRYGDVAVGFGRKHIRWQLAPAPYMVEAKADQNDFGFAVRATPLQGTDTGRPSLDVAYGFAALNYIGPLLARYPTFGWLGGADIPSQYRHGVAARVGFPRSPGVAAGLERRFGRRLASTMDPLLSVVVAADFTRYQLGPQVRYGSGVDQVGLELIVANTLAVRLGHVGDESRGIDGYSFGLGLALALTDLVGARYDYARYPQASSLGMLDRHAVAMWFDPVAFLQR